MGKKGKWFGAVKKVFSPESKEKKEEKLRKKLAASSPNPPDLTPSASLEVDVLVPPPPALPALHQSEEVKVPEAEQEQSRSRASMLLWRQPQHPLGKEIGEKQKRSCHVR